MSKQYLKYLDCRKNECKKPCDNCDKKPKILYQPNGFIVNGDTAPWEVCRPCLDKLFTLSKTNKGVKND